MLVYMGPYDEGGDNREVIVKLHPYDTWSADHTLAHIIVPMLIQLRDNTHSSGYVEDEDVPKELQRPENADEHEADEFWHKRWEYVLNEMIWAFTQIRDAEDMFDLETHDRIVNGTTLFGKYYRSLWD